MTKRRQGKAGFMHIKIWMEKFRFMYVKMYLVMMRMKYSKKSDLGDIVGIEGKVMKQIMENFLLRLKFIHT